MFSIGLDIGTTSVCGILHNTANGEIIKSITRENDSFIKTENSWEKIQSPDRLIEILYSILDELLKAEQNVVSIGLSGQMHGIVYIDADGNAVSPLKIWQDGRGNLEFKNGKTYAQYMSESSGYQLATGYGAVTYFYDLQNGLVPENAVSFCTIHDLAAMKLTASKKPLMHPSNAASLGLYDIKANLFDEKSISKLGLNFYMFPTVCNGYTVMGYYKGIPVSVALGDNQASFLGSVSDMDNSILVNVGTGSQISCLVNTPPENSSLDCRPLLDNSYIIAGSSLCGGRAYAILEKLFREIATTVSGCEIGSAYPAMDRITENLEYCDNPLNVSTLFSGTRANPDERGKIENIGIENFTMTALCDGVMCGIADELFDFYSAMKPYLCGEKTIMVASGNGVRVNIALQKRFERIFGMSLKTPLHKEEAAFGASLYALVSAGIYSDINTAQKLLKYI